MEESPYLTVAEVATQLRVYADSVRIWLRAGVLPGAALGCGGAYRIRQVELDAFVASRLGRPTLRQRPGEPSRRR